MQQQLRYCSLRACSEFSKDGLSSPPALASRLYSTNPLRISVTSKLNITCAACALKVGPSLGARTMLCGNSRRSHRYAKWRASDAKVRKACESGSAINFSEWFQDSEWFSDALGVENALTATNEHMRKREATPYT
eukprot:1109760-Pleurochrysis_carterae.AAC.1